jgi:hypothetical protein
MSEKSELPNPYIEEMEKTIQLLFREMIQKAERRTNAKRKQKQRTNPNV